MEFQSRERRTAVVEVLAERRAVEVGYDAEHERAGLPIVPSLAAADETALAISDTVREIVRKPNARRRNGERGVAAAAGDDPAGVQTDIEPGPGEGAWIPERSATGLREADLHILSELGKQSLERRLEAEAFTGREVGGEDDLLDFLVGCPVDIEVARQPSA